MSQPTTPAIHPALRPGHGLNERARQILNQRLYAVLGTENDDGTAHLVPVMFLFDEAKILIETGAATRKARNVAAHGRATVLVQTPEPAWVLATGSAAIIYGPESRRANQRIRAKYLTPEGQLACGDLLDELDDITIVLRPTRWLTWEMTSFMETLGACGVDLDQADTWFINEE